ncbi:MAG: hypothetical protein K6F88_03935 [Ruminococcus sp.]|nr:hypothetical protein [Ruminococcus sp.]
MVNAWHLRQDGKFFPVQVHLYAMGDGDLSSEAEVASFLLKTDSEDKRLSRRIIDAWIALCLEDKVRYDDTEEDIIETIRNLPNELPYHFAYPLTGDELVEIHTTANNFNDVDTLYEFIDKILLKEHDDLCLKIRRSINQQFCRIRYGGKLNTVKGSESLWFRISSVGFNWQNVICDFVTDLSSSRPVSDVSVCRDQESDNTEADYFYKTKDGRQCYHMPIQEYLAKESESSPIIDANLLDISRGVYATLWLMFQQGVTYFDAIETLRIHGAVPNRDFWSYFIRKERDRYCVESSEEEDALNRRDQRKLLEIKHLIFSMFPEIADIDIDLDVREKTEGNETGYQSTFVITFVDEKKKTLTLFLASKRPLNNSTARVIARKFQSNIKKLI